MITENALPDLPDLPDLDSPTQLHAVELKREKVPVPEWGRTVWVWEMTGAQLEEYRQGMYRTRGTKLSFELRNNTARLLAQAMRRKDGAALWGSEEEAVHRLQGMPASALERLASVARRLSGLDHEDDEDPEGNSVAAPSGSESSTSPSPSGDL